MPKNITILYGLPGSGKTFYTKRLNDPWYYTIVHMDDYIVDGKYKSITEVLSGLKGSIKKYLVIDSLITTQKKLEEIIKETHDFFENSGGARYDLKIVYWNENRDACRENIKRRADGRNVSVTIDNIPFEEVDEDRIRKFVYDMDRNVQLSFKHRNVFTNGNWDLYFQPLIDNSWGEENNKYYYSEYWSRGGTWGNCWGGKGDIKPDEQPEFNTFDNLLEYVCPNISYIQYKNIFKECVEIDEYKESDYYGGTEYKSRYKFDVRKCYEILLERNLIEE
jgi:hypothetical protein